MISIRNSPDIEPHSHVKTCQLTGSLPELGAVVTTHVNNSLQYLHLIFTCCTACCTVLNCAVQCWQCLGVAGSVRCDGQFSCFLASEQLTVNSYRLAAVTPDTQPSSHFLLELFQLDLETLISIMNGLFLLKRLSRDLSTKIFNISLSVSVDWRLGGL